MHPAEGMHWQVEQCSEGTRWCKMTLQSDWKAEHSRLMQRSWRMQDALIPDWKLFGAMQWGGTAANIEITLFDNTVKPDLAKTNGNLPSFTYVSFTHHCLGLEPAYNDHLSLITAKARLSCCINPSPIQFDFKSKILLSLCLYLFTLSL